MYDLWVYAIQISVWITRIYTYIKNLMHSYTHTLIHSYIHTLIHSYTRTLIHSYTHIHTHTYTQTHNLACTHTSTRPHSLQTHTRTHTRAHTYTHNTVDTSRLRLTYKWGESLLKSWRVLENSVWFWIRTTWQCSQTRDCHPETAVTHCNNTLQQHTATTHCNNTLQQHSATTLCNNTASHGFQYLLTPVCILHRIYTHTLSNTHTHTHTHTNTSAKRFSNLDSRYVSGERARTIEIWTPLCNNTPRHTATNVRISLSTGVHIQMDWHQRWIIWDWYR